MKYVSPQTEKRKQQQKKRQQQMLTGAAIVVVIIVVLVAAISIIGQNKPSSESGDNIISSDSQVENTVSDSSGQGTSEENQTPESQDNDKPKKEKQSIFKKIGSIFSKDKNKTEDFPATSFGVQVYEAADSIISLSPLATEVILSSPSQHALAAVSEYCNKRGNDLMTVGTPLIPKADKIIQLAPDYLIVQNPLSEQDKVKIEQSGVTVLQLDYPESLEDLKEIYRSITALTQGAEKATRQAEKIYGDISEKLALYDTALADVKKKNAVMLFNSYGMVATKDTLEGVLLSTFFDNAVSGQNYFTESLENVAAANPQVIIVSDTITYEQLGELGFAETDAYINEQIYYVNIQDFENISAKSIKTLMGIANSVYDGQIKPAPTASPEAE